jgi:hypothetical protein
LSSKLIDVSGGREGGVVGGAFFLLCIRTLGRESDRALGLARVNIALSFG